MWRPRSTRIATWPRLTRRGATLVIVGVLLLAVSLWFDSRDVLVLAFVGIAMPAVAALFVGLRKPSLGVTRRFAPPVVEAGTSTRVALVIKNRSRRTFDGAHWRDRVPSTLTAAPEAILPAMGPYESMLPSGDDTVRVEYRLRTPRRGVYPIGPLRVGVADPFGLARVDRDIGVAHEVLVTPRVTPLDTALGSAASVDGVLNGLQLRTHPNSDELIAREYRYGDPLRRVNWAATARRGELMVREEEQRGDPEARIILDTTLAGRAKQPGRRRDGDEGPHFGFELGVEVAASIGMHLLEHGYRVRCDRLDDPERGLASGESGAGYRMPGGDRLMLEDLARLDGPNGSASARTAPSAREHGAGSRGRDARMPGFAVLVDPDEHDARSLVALRSSIEPAVAFATEAVAPGIVDLLEKADWRVVRVRRAAEIAAAWSGTTRVQPATPRNTAARRGPVEPGVSDAP
ncbi:DUF58 domain-containing protein [Agromyces cerinus]|uniref:Uncharacterized conserved protein, DUF58 family, contains vWF domain n=1 Tax=Agromyces cerinus subsp. cerinus TaxID=232089 RepID=A0A1N6DLE5_9MICO|nr:DUF58 domain-containing protein [Agromyces cerinus]SIN71605.1 Uncharacterized conserved protein, DUF58 family, contains vWF domain [Agromyces cerinus subsp. cerinus]